MKDNCYHITHPYHKLRHVHNSICVENIWNSEKNSWLSCAVLFHINNILRQKKNARALWKIKLTTRVSGKFLNHVKWLYSSSTLGKKRKLKDGLCFYAHIVLCVGCVCAFALYKLFVIKCCWQYEWVHVERHNKIIPLSKKKKKKKSFNYITFFPTTDSILSNFETYLQKVNLLFEFLVLMLQSHSVGRKGSRVGQYVKIFQLQ